MVCRLPGARQREGQAGHRSNHPKVVRHDAFEVCPERLSSGEMNRVEAPKARTVELRSRVEKRVVQAKHVETLKETSRARKRRCSLRSHCPDDLNTSEGT